MATTAKKKPAATAAKQPRQQGLSDMQRWMLGVILFVVGLLILLSVISYFFYWKADQAITTHGALVSDMELTVHNWCGKLGARVANFIVGRWFGLFGICVPIVIMIVALAEITSFPSIPLQVSFNEYIEIAKSYSTAKSGTFINGVLEAITSLLKKEGRLEK